MASLQRPDAFVDSGEGSAVRPVRVSARRRGERQPPRSACRRDSRVIGSRLSISWDPPKRLWQRSFRSCGPKTARAVGSGEQLTRDGVHLLEGDVVDLAEGVRDAAVFAVVELTAADAVIRDPESSNPSTSPPRSDPLAIRHSASVMPSRATFSSTSVVTRTTWSNRSAGTRRRPTVPHCRRRCPRSSTPNTPGRVFPDLLEQPRTQAAAQRGVSTDSAHRWSQFCRGSHTDRQVRLFGFAVGQLQVGRPVTRPVPLRGATGLRP